MRAVKAFLWGFAGLEGVALVGLGLVAHRVDLWLDWQIGLAPAALATALLAVLAIKVRDHVAVSTTRLHRYVDDVPEVETTSLTKRIGRATPLALVPQRRDGPIEGTKRP